MKMLRPILFAAALAALPAWAQTAKTTEQQARSYLLSAFMTGSAPTVLSEDVKIAPTLRERLALAPDSDSRAAYYALVRITAGRSLTVRPAKIDELERTETQVETGKPVFALDVSDTTFVMRYDLDRDAVTQVATPQPVAVTSPVSTPEPAQPTTSTAAAAAVAEAKKPAAEPASAPAAAVQVVEPREPNFSRPEALQTRRDEPRRPPLKPSGPCVVKPVMSDQDLVNCGASPR